MKYPKTCKRSGAAFTAKGPAARYCGKCDECKAADSSPAPKAEKPERPRRPVDTGFKGEPPGSTRAATSSGLTGAIAEIKSELETIDARRDELRSELTDALEQLRELVST